MIRLLRLKFILPALLLVGMGWSTETVNGQARIELDDGRWVSVGGGLRTAFRTAKQPDGSYSKDVHLDNARLYFNAQVHDSILVELTTEYIQSSSELRVLDAVAKLNASEYFSVWAGRHLPPSDRANLDGPFYLSAYEYPGLVSRYPGIFAGRDDGVSASGQVQGGVFKYAFGMYKGITQALGQKDTSLYAARFTFNFLDPEPGYYASSSYYGDKDILAVGFVVQYQGEAIAGPGTTFQNFRGYNLDFLFEKQLTNDGVISLEGAYYNYDRGTAAGGGKAYLAQAGYLIAPMVGPGQFQPMVRFQEFEGDSILDAGVNYVIRGHSARISATYSRVDSAGSQSGRFTLGTQFQY
jgi:hypothetical protein